MTSAARLRVDPAIAAAHPSYAAVVLYATGLRNGPSDHDGVDALRAAAARKRDEFDGAPARSHPHIASWRAAFGSFGAKPSRYPCSAEALLSRVLRGDEPPAINRLVDAYNAVSIDRVLPIGGEDLDRVAGQPVLRFATGTEPFVALDRGVEAATTPSEGEAVWADDEGVTCRRWNWRQCLRTRLREDTTSAYFLLESIGEYPRDELLAAADALAAALADGSPGASIEHGLLDAGGEG